MAIASPPNPGPASFDLKRRGLAAPVLAVGDGNPGFWAALGEVYPDTKEQRWRRVNAPHLVALVKTGVQFPNGEAEMFRS